MACGRVNVILADIWNRPVGPEDLTGVMALARDITEYAGAAGALPYDHKINVRGGAAQAKPAAAYKHLYNGN